jgi:CRISPR/Cas system CSM-associated protein Csm2 small subunit
MAEAERDIQSLLKGKQIEPNAAANTAYAQKILDYTRDNKENIKFEIWEGIMAYLDALQPIIMSNNVRKIDETLVNE